MSFEFFLCLCFFLPELLADVLLMSPLLLEQLPIDPAPEFDWSVPEAEPLEVAAPSLPLD